MKKNILLYSILIVLLLANGFFISQNIGGPDRGDRRGKGPESFISKQLDLDASQQQQYQKLTSTHREAMKSIDTDIRVLKDEFFSNISNESITTLEIDSIASLISDKEKLKDIEVFNHFKALRAICNDEQKAKFNAIMKDGLRPPGRKNRSRTRQ